MSLATVSRYVPKTKPDATQQQRWMILLRNHKDAIAGMDLFVVPTARQVIQQLSEYFAYDDIQRVHTSISNAPVGRHVESRPSEHAKLQEFPLSGLGNV